jgi:hypothetical protein
MFCVFQSKGGMWKTAGYSSGEAGAGAVARDVRG